MKIKSIIGLSFLLSFFSCSEKAQDKHVANEATVSIQVLGIAQDAGYPQINCQKSCCKDLWKDLDKRKMVSCIGIRDHANKKAWLFDATPDIKDQLNLITNAGEYSLEGIFLTHAHMGHYTGLMEFGREALGSDGIAVYALPRLKTFIESNGPWSQLVSLNNIKLIELKDSVEVFIAPETRIMPFLVPHRDEFSETAGYKIIHGNKRALFIPDIDKWEKWNHDIRQVVKKVDIAFLDGSFFRNGEIWGRDMSQIPHPFIEESMALFDELESSEKAKINFIHLNHTNPLLRKETEAYKLFQNSDYKLADEGQVFNFD